MNLADLRYYADTQVDTPYLARLVAAEPSLEGISALAGGSTLGIATPRQRKEAQAIRKQVQPVVNAVTDPVYAFTPGTDQRRQDARRRILEKVAAVTTDPMAATFAGVGAKMADKAALARSLEMKAAGVADREIWQQTGWTHGFPDGKPRFEIDDSAAAYAENMPTFSRLKENRPIADSFDHAELYENYPYVAQLKLNEIEGNALGSFDAAAGAVNVGGIGPPKWYSTKKRFRDAQGGAARTTLHETQHAIQGKEGFAQGGSPSAMQLEYNNARARLNFLENDPDYIKANQQSDELWNKVFNGEIPEQSVVEIEQSLERAYPVLKETKDIMKQLNQLGDDSGHNAYKRLAGEVEARLVQRRRDYSAQKRQGKYPIDDMDVKPQDQIVRFK